LAAAHDPWTQAGQVSQGKLRAGNNRHQALERVGLRSLLLLNALVLGTPLMGLVGKGCGELLQLVLHGLQLILR
jgi:hypothetical protein